MSRLGTGRFLALLGAATALAILVTACGSSGGGSSSGGGETTAESSTAESSTASTDSGGGSGAAGDIVAESETYIEENAPGARELPTSSPKPPADLNVWVMPCAAAASGCLDVQTGVEDANKVLGWKLKTFDGENNPAKWAEGINQAVAAGAEVLITAAVDCGPVKSALQKAKAAGVISINVAGYDCEAVGGENEFTDTVMPAEGETSWSKTAEVSGALQAAWAIEHTEAEVKAIQLTNEEQELSIGLGAGFREYLKKCSTCEILEEVPFRLTEFGDPLTQKASSALLANPDANILDAPYDPAALPAAQAVVAAGKSETVPVLGAIGDPASTELIREGRGQAMDVGWDDLWLGWAAMDDAIRLIDKQKPVYSGWALGLIDAEHLPKTDQYHAPVDYEANYEKIWKGQ